MYLTLPGSKVLPEPVNFFARQRRNLTGTRVYLPTDNTARARTMWFIAKHL
jgi:hypothetical protein